MQSFQSLELAKSHIQEKWYTPRHHWLSPAGRPFTLKGAFDFCVNNVCLIRCDFFFWPDSNFLLLFLAFDSGWFVWIVEDPPQRTSAIRLKGRRPEKCPGAQGEANPWSRNGTSPGLLTRGRARHTALCFCTLSCTQPSFPWFSKICILIHFLLLWSQKFIDKRPFSPY